MWPLLDKNEFVDILAPSGSISEEDLTHIREYLQREGFKPRIPENILGKHPFSANRDELRFRHLKNALEASDSTLLWCVRGGHGMSNLMPDLIQLPKPKKQKLIVGFSDICSLHLWVNQAWQWPSLHGPMARLCATGKTDAQDLQALDHLWFKGLTGYKIQDLIPLNAAAEKMTLLEGMSGGGCLSVLQTSLGTPWQIDGRNKILFLEDVNEEAYRIHRSLIHLANAGIFDHAKALVFGDFGEPAKDTQNIRWALEDIATHYLSKRSIVLPVYRLQGFGHGHPNQPLPFHVSLRVEKNTLFF